MRKTLIISLCVAALFGAIVVAIGMPPTAAGKLTFSAIAFVIVALPTFAAWCEERQWNDGICARYNEPWEYFDTDSQGGRGYKCRDTTCWISYPVEGPRRYQGREIILS